MSSHKHRWYQQSERIAWCTECGTLKVRADCGTYYRYPSSTYPDLNYKRLTPRKRKARRHEA